MFSIIAICAAIVLYLLTAVIRIVFANDKSGNVILAVLAILNILVHIALFGLCIYLKAATQEIFFVLVVSTALALTVTKVGREKEE